MARKPHLVVMTDETLLEYKTQLNRELVAVLVELRLRERREETIAQWEQVGPAEPLGPMFAGDEPDAG